MLLGVEAREQTSSVLDEKHEGQTDVWQRECRQSSGFYGFGQMDPNSSAVAFALNSIQSRPLVSNLSSQTHVEPN